MNDYEDIIYEVEDHVATITMNRPEVLNALGSQMPGELEHALLKADEDNEVRAVVLTGAGRGFCTGVDLKWVVQNRLDQGWTSDKATTAAQYRSSRVLSEDVTRNDVLFTFPYWQIAQVFERYRKPLIAAVNGPAYGGGLLLALGPDFAVASESATFCAIFGKRGFAFEAATSHYLVKRVGPAWSHRMQYLGEAISGDLAIQIGLCTEVVPDDQLMPRVLEMAREIALKRPAYAMSLSKIQVQKAYRVSDPEVMGMLEAYALEQIQRGHDYYEGEQAFVEKREPVYRGY